MKQNLKSVNIWQSYKQESDCVHFLRLLAVCWPGAQGSVATYARCGRIFNIHLTANLPRNLPLKIFLIG